MASLNSFAPVPPEYADPDEHEDLQRYTPVEVEQLLNKKVSVRQLETTVGSSELQVTKFMLVDADGKTIISIFRIIDSNNDDWYINELCKGAINRLTDPYKYRP